KELTADSLENAKVFERRPSRSLCLCGEFFAFRTATVSPLDRVLRKMLSHDSPSSLPLAPADCGNPLARAGCEWLTENRDAAASRDACGPVHWHTRDRCFEASSILAWHTPLRTQVRIASRRPERSFEAAEDRHE